MIAHSACLGVNVWSAARSLLRQTWQAQCKVSSERVHRKGLPAYLARMWQALAGTRMQ